MISTTRTHNPAAKPARPADRSCGLVLFAETVAANRGTGRRAGPPNHSNTPATGTNRLAGYRPSFRRK